MPSGADVVVAPATPSGRGALAVVRCSGSGVLDVLRDVVRPRRPWAPGRARRVALFDRDGAFDDGRPVDCG